MVIVVCETNNAAIRILCSHTIILSSYIALFFLLSSALTFSFLFSIKYLKKVKWGNTKTSIYLFDTLRRVNGHFNKKKIKTDN